MRLMDCEALCVRYIQMIVEVKSPPSGTRIRRIGKYAAYDRFFYCDGGHTVQRWGEKSVTIGDADVVFIPRYLEYTDTIIAEGDVIIAYIDLNLPADDLIVKWSFRDNPKMKQHFLSLRTLWKQHKSGYYPQCMGELYAILNMIWRMEKIEYVSPKAALSIAPASEYLESHFNDQDFDIPRLAARCDISYSHFRKLFFDVYGMSASAYLQKLRLEYACRLLQTGDHSVSETAFMSGFKDAFYFSGFFKRHMGLTPIEYAHKIKPGE